MKASPQTRNGFTRIANELLMAIVGAGFNGREMAVVLFIIRYTYGYHRKTHHIGTSFISEHAGIDRRDIRKTINNLIRLSVLLRHADGSLGLQKDYRAWGGANIPPKNALGGANIPPKGERCVRNPLKRLGLTRVAWSLKKTSLKKKDFKIIESAAVRKARKECIAENNLLGLEVLDLLTRKN